MRRGTQIVALEKLLAGLLGYGTGLACAVLGVGMLARIWTPGGLIVMKSGIALFILLPIARVAFMLFAFLRARDYPYTGIAALVLAIIFTGIVINT